MKRFGLIILAFAVLGFNQLYGQGASLRIDSNSLASIPLVVNMNSAYTVPITIYNDSSATFHGDITFGGSVNGDTLLADTSASNVLQYANAGTPDSIPGHGSIVRSLIIHIQNPPFIIGTSGVVIWPKASNFTNQIVIISDSVNRRVNATYPVGVSGISERNLKVYINGDQQLVIGDDGNYLLKNVKIFDISGKLLEEQAISASGAVNMNQYPAGVYLAEVNFADNTRMVFKVFSNK